MRLINWWRYVYVCCWDSWEWWICNLVSINSMIKKGEKKKGACTAHGFQILDIGAKNKKNFFFFFLLVMLTRCFVFGIYRNMITSYVLLSSYMIFIPPSFLGIMLPADIGEEVWNNSYDNFNWTMNDMIHLYLYLQAEARLQVEMSKPSWSSIDNDKILVPAIHQPWSLI